MQACLPLSHLEARIQASCVRLEVGSRDANAPVRDTWPAAGFWAFQNFLRPLRFSLALTLAPAFNSIISYLEASFRLPRRQAFGLYVFLLGVVTSTLTFGSVFLFCGPAAFAR